MSCLIPPWTEPWNGQVAGARLDHYGSEGWGSSPSEHATVLPGHSVDLSPPAAPFPSSGRIMAG